MFDDAFEVLLGQCADIRAGYPFRGPVPATSDPAGVLVAQIKDVRPEEGVDWSSAVRAELTGRKTPDWLEQGDLLFVPRGTRFYGTSIGTPPGPAVCGPHLFHLRLRDPAVVLPEFLAWQLNQPPIQKQLAVAAEGSSQLSVRRSEIESLRVAVPSIPDQHAVVAASRAAREEREVLLELIANRELELAAVAAALASAAAGTPITKREDDYQSH